MKHINELSPGNYPLRIRSLELEVEEGGARWVRLILESTDKDTYGNIIIIHPAPPPRQEEGES